MTFNRVLGAAGFLVLAGNAGWTTEGTSAPRKGLSAATASTANMPPLTPSSVITLNALEDPLALPFLLRALDNEDRRMQRAAISGDLKLD